MNVKGVSAIPKRIILISMVFIGYINLYYVHTNVGMAVVTITSPKFGSNHSKPEFDWSSKAKGLVVSSLNYGRLFGPIGGILAGILGGSTLYSLSILLIALISASSPFLLYTSFYLFITANVTIGVLEAFSYACVSQLWSRWAPPNERSKFISFSVIGIFIGSIMSFSLAGYILKKFPWPVLYYITGTIGVIWFCIWFLTVSNDPEQHKTITKKEQAYIIEAINSPKEKIIYPWKEIFTCPPFLVGCCAKFASATGSSFVLSYLPQYIKDTSNLEIDKIGYVSTIPMIFSLISMPLSGCLADYVRKNNLISLTNLHRCFGGIGLLTGGIVFIIISQWPNLIGSIICISVYQFFMTMNTIDTQILVLDLAPRYAAFLNACTNSFYTSASILSPTYVSFVVTDHSRYQWNICFTTISAFYFIAAVLYVKFVSGERQPWANYKI